MNDFQNVTCSMDQALYWIKQDLEASGFDRVVLDSTNNFFCIGDGTPDPFDGFKMVCAQPFHKKKPLWKIYANR